MSVRRPGPLNRLRSLRRLHRWLGLTCIAFILALSTTGIALNHTEDLQLDSRFVTADWLLGLYGIGAPQPDSSFDIGSARVTLMGSRLYLDDREAARNVGAIVGAASFRGLAAVATPDALLFIDSDAQVVDRIDTGSLFSYALDYLGVLSDRIVVGAGGAAFEYDWQIGSFMPAGAGTGRIAVIEPSPVPPALLARLERSYRGDGVSIERLISDIHSGRIVTRAGVLIADMAGLALIVLAATGFLIWLRR
jgi:hypothetical protein